MARETISIVMTFHAEGRLAHWSLLGFDRMRRLAEANDIQTQLVAVLDNADAETSRVVNSHPVLQEGDLCINTSHGDPGMSRNSGVASASGKYLGILDGDDYCSANWIVAALDILKRYPNSVVHTDYLVVFDAFWGLGKQTNQLLGEGRLESCFKYHLWVSAVIAEREIFLDCPYRVSRMSSGFGYEDWDWSLAVLARGLLHATAPQTALFYRQKLEQSRQRIATSEQVILRPGPFFSPEFWR